MPQPEARDEFLRLCEWAIWHALFPFLAFSSRREHNCKKHRLVDREGRIAISHARVVDPLVFEADINAVLAEYVSVRFRSGYGTESSDLLCRA